FRLTVVDVLVGVVVELLDPGLLLGGDRVEAANALALDVHPCRSGHEHPLDHRFEPQVELDVGAFGDTDHDRPEVRGGWDDPAGRTHRPGSAAEVAGVHDERAARVEPGQLGLRRAPRTSVPD